MATNRNNLIINDDVGNFCKNIKYMFVTSYRLLATAFQTLNYMCFVTFVIAITSGYLSVHRLNSIIHAMIAS